MDLDDELKATRRMNGSDKNVGSIEDIEGLKRLFYANALTQYGKRKLIGYYEQQIKELEENRIPISLVKEKIEEYTKLLKSCNRFSDVDRIKAINERILAYKELLEKRK